VGLSTPAELLDSKLGSEVKSTVMAGRLFRAFIRKLKNDIRFTDHCASDSTASTMWHIKANLIQSNPIQSNQIKSNQFNSGTREMTEGETDILHTSYRFFFYLTVRKSGLALLSALN